MLPDAYQQLGDASSAARLFRRSRQLFKHVHNPAIWQLFILQFRRLFASTTGWLTVITVLFISFAIYACG